MIANSSSRNIYIAFCSFIKKKRERKKEREKKLGADASKIKQRN
jgi:hypothetical protein